MTIDRRSLLAFGALFGAQTLARAAEPAPAPPPAPALDPVKEKRIHEDWAFLDRYRADNTALLSAGTKADVVFMGDSITKAGWRRIRSSSFRGACAVASAARRHRKCWCVSATTSSP